MYNDCYYPNLLEQRTRDGSIRRESTVHGFSDASFACGDDFGLEVASSVPASCELPDDFNQAEVKYERIQNQLHSKAYSRFRNWETQFAKISIVIIDPMRVVDSTREGKDRYLASKRLLALDPTTWAFMFPVELDGVVYETDCFLKWSASLNQGMTLASNVKGVSLANVRRHVAKAQILHLDILRFQPVRFEQGSLEFSYPRQAPNARDLALALTSKVGFDEGHFDLPKLLPRLTSDQKRLLKLSRFYRVPEVRSAYLREINSSKNELVQLADVSAGYARKLFRNPSTRGRLPQVFKAVFVNGEQMLR